jgi:hypothetical protein
MRKQPPPRVIVIPAGQLRRTLSDYIAVNGQATAHLAGFLEAHGVTAGAARIEITGARIVITPPEPPVNPPRADRPRGAGAGGGRRRRP